MSKFLKLLVAFLLLGLFTEGLYAQCNAYFYHSVTGNVVFLTDSSSASSSSNHYWDFGDNSTLSTSSWITNHSHAYASPGTYTVCLTVTDSIGNCVDSICKTLTVFNSCHAELNISLLDPWTVNYTSNSSSGGIWPYPELQVSGPENLYAAYASSTPSPTGILPLEITTGDTKSGNYDACHIISDSSSNCYDSTCTSFSIFGNNGKCYAYFTFSDSGKTITFIDSSSQVSNTKGYFWDFGDDSYSNRNITTQYNSGPNQTVSFTYHRTGSYQACFTVIDSANSCATKHCETIVIGPPVCNANYNYHFTGGVHNFVDISNSSYGHAFQWDFGDGTIDSTDSSPSHTYSAPGVYNVCLAIVDSVTTMRDTFCSIIVVTGGQTSCQAYFTSYQALDSNNNPIPNQLIVLDSSTGSNLSYYWDFGDGNSSYLQNPTHTYSGNGPYVLCLTVSDSVCTSTFCDTLSVDTHGIINKSGSGFTINVGGMNPIAIGVNEIRQGEIKAYPNPFSNQINLEFSGFTSGPVDVFVINSMGKTIMQSSIFIDDGDIKFIDLSGHPPGIYFIQIKSESNKYLEKLIKL